MKLNIAYFFAFLIATNLNAQNAGSKEVKYSARFKSFAFNEDINDIGYLENKELRPLSISAFFISPEVSYSGKPEIDFVKQIKPKTEETEVESYSFKRAESSKNLQVIGDAYNKLTLRLNEIYRDARTQDREELNSSEKMAILEINSEMELLSKKMSQAEAELAESNTKYLKSLSTNNAVKVDSSKIHDVKKEILQAKYEPLAKFTIPASGGNYILIFNKTPNGVTISPLNDAPGVFPFGSYQFINLTGTTVELRFGSKVIPLSPNGRTVFKPETANGEYLEGEFWTKVDDEFKLGYKFRNLHISRIRTLAFIMPTAPGQSALNLKIAEERGQAEPPPADNSKSKDKKAKESEKKESENRPFG